jgi:hypothetical protein
MTIKEIMNALERIQEHDSWDFYVWLTWFVNKHSCVDCVETNITLNKRPNCLKCIPSTSLIRKRIKNLQHDYGDEGCAVSHIINHKISRKKEMDNENQQK